MSGMARDYPFTSSAYETRSHAASSQRYRPVVASRRGHAPFALCRLGAGPIGPHRSPGGTMAEQQRDVIEVLEHDHREVEQMFAELESLRGASTEEAKARRKDLADQVTIELVRHSVAEEVLVYPKVEKQVSAEE